MINRIKDFLFKRDNFSNWLMDKMNITKMDYVANGTYGIVFDIGDDKVLKLTYIPCDLYKKTVRKSNSNKHITKVFRIGTIKVPSKYIDDNAVSLPNYLSINVKGGMLSYLIMERLNIVNVVGDLSNLIKLFQNIKKYTGINYTNDSYSAIYNIIKYRKKYINDFDKDIEYEIRDNNTLTEQEKQEYIKLYHMFIGAIFDALRIFPEFDDYHIGQFGYDRNGILKIFDIVPNEYIDFKIHKKTHIA